jgi:hypothetical protein
MGETSASSSGGEIEESEDPNQEEPMDAIE